MKTLIASVVIAALVPATTVRAESLEEKRFHEQHEKSLQANLDSTNKACTSTITATFDWSSIKFDDWQQKFGGNPYQAAGRALIEVCKQDDGKAAVKKSIKTIVIKGTTDTPKLELAKNGELDYYLAINGPKHGCCYAPAQNDAVAYLMKHL